MAHGKESFDFEIRADNSHRRRKTVLEGKLERSMDTRTSGMNNKSIRQHASQPTNRACMKASSLGESEGKENQSSTEFRSVRARPEGSERLENEPTLAVDVDRNNGPANDSK